LSLRLLIDEDTQAKRLVEVLRVEGHDVVTVTEAGLESQDDAILLEFALRENRILVTRNCDEFRDRHDADPAHAGIFAIYEGRVGFKKMSHAEIVQAVANLDASGLDFAGQFVAVNAWKY
jgi:hypothetical protein